MIAQSFQGLLSCRDRLVPETGITFYNGLARQACASDEGTVRLPIHDDRLRAESPSPSPRRCNNPHILPGIKEGQHLGDMQRLWYAIRYAAKLPGLRLQDLRHSYASVPAASGESMLVLRSLLGHKNVGTAERYPHLSDNPVKRAADGASKDIARWLGGEPTA